MTTPDLPPGLPPLPPNTCYGGFLRDHTGFLAAFVYDEADRAGWDFGQHWRGMADDKEGAGADWHVALLIEAVREPARDQLPAAFRDAFAEHFPAFREQMKAIAGASGVEARVCEDIAARQRLGIAKCGCTVEQSLASVIEKSP